LERSFGIMLLTRLPVKTVEVVRLRPDGLPVIVACLHCDGQLVTVICAHPLSPTYPKRLRLRNELLAALAEFTGTLTGPVMLLGDLNTTSWNPAFRDLLRMSGLRDTRLGLGLQTSWPAGVPLIGITLDHCLVSAAISIRGRALGPQVGSDHAPVVIDCTIHHAGVG
jgi:endonuclease/exonuclease/phosphatase (EEP) superfamily protein YafD